MKKIFVIGIILMFSFSVLIGCESSEDKSVNSTKKINIEKLIEYRDSYVGDNSAVGGILYNLPGNMYVKQFSLQTNNTPYSIKVDYGLDKNSNLKKEDFNKFWDSESVKNIFLNNATTLFILVKNVDEVEFNLDTPNKQSFSITRKELETFYGKDLREYSNDISVWKKEIIDSSEKKEDLFKNHSIITAE
ncbi:DUF4825 domain-containing protein [Tepidibacter aestuarii]|uniref:DUF4825 domain-containing protein n=1 Tax=Tepidibacter aestuarii TaxID=2925782 RepID=UPI0020C0DE02|nr:DUF4825 domain-containing protein [Tepidibacter aestuarii]CAH2214208.1 putative lipoprotein [Tepidibacter aestuarii]